MTTLYKLVDKSGNFLKWGITQNLAKRYTGKYLAGLGAATPVPVTQGSRSLMMLAERWLIQTARGPLNNERIKGILQSVLQQL
jgi:hypothetical protein